MFKFFKFRFGMIKEEMMIFIEVFLENFCSFYFFVCYSFQVEKVYKLCSLFVDLYKVGIVVISDNDIYIVGG